MPQMPSVPFVPDDYADTDTYKCERPTCQLCYPDYMGQMSQEQRDRIDAAQDDELKKLFHPELGGEG